MGSDDPGKRGWGETDDFFGDLVAQKKMVPSGPRPVAAAFTLSDRLRQLAPRLERALSTSTAHLLFSRISRKVQLAYEEYGRPSSESYRNLLSLLSEADQLAGELEKELGIGVPPKAASEVLEAAREYLVRGWCRHHHAEDARGQPVLATSHRAKRWSLLGATLAAAGLEEKAHKEALRFLVSATGRPVDQLFAWNKERERTLGEVLQAVERAIFIAREVEGRHPRRVQDAE